LVVRALCEFRRLAERKGSPPIDYEVVLVQRKPGAGG